MTPEDMKRWFDMFDREDKNPNGSYITIPIIYDLSLPRDGWYLKPDFIEWGSE